MKILLVDDSSFKRKAFGYAIERQGHEVIDAEDGVDGLEKARSHKPDIIITDLLMPRMDGFQFIRNLKKDEQLSEIPVVAYSSTYTDEKVREHVIAIGANDFFSEQATPEAYWQQLLEAVESGRYKKGKVGSLAPDKDEELIKDYVSIVVTKLEEKVKELEEEIEIKRQTEEALKESEEKLLAWFNSTPDSISISRLSDGEFVEINKAAEKIFGYYSEEVVGKTSKQLNIWADPNDRDRMTIELKKAGRIDYLETRLRRKSGEIFPAQISISVVNIKGEPYLFIVCQDITRLKNLEAQLLQSQKLEALGRLVGGIAHEFNNMLMAIVGYAGILQMKMNKDDPLVVNVEQVLEAADRGANLTRNLLILGRKETITLRITCLNGIINNVKRHLSSLIDEGVELRVVLAEGELRVTADPTLIELLLVNLVTNACDAMRNGGVLTIETGHESLDNEFVKRHGYGEPGEYAVVRISDTGEGMDERITDKVFEPFFTTKEVGQGTGLGLSIVYSIVQQLMGYLHVESEVGKGSSFKIYLPLTKQAVEKAEEIPAEIIKGGAETILVAEDNDSLRRLSRIVLQHHGYNVIEAVDGEDAVNKFIENKDSIVLALLDGIMPKKNGKEVYYAIKAIAPKIKVIFLSGYAEFENFHKDIQDSEAVYIQKPILPKDLLIKVREVLGK